MKEIEIGRTPLNRRETLSPQKSPEGPLDKAARRFESMVVEGMVREMWKTIPVSREEGRSAGLSLAQELYQKELSKELVDRLVDAVLGFVQVVLGSKRRRIGVDDHTTHDSPPHTVTDTMAGRTGEPPGSFGIARPLRASSTI